MTALIRLSRRLRGSLAVAQQPFPACEDIDAVIAGLEKHNKAGAGTHIPEDLLFAAVRKFWQTPRFETIRDARLVCFGMCVPIRPSGPCIMEDRERFLAVLDLQTGVDQWRDDTRWYRRCFQGLMRSYFTYDAKFENASADGRRNWHDLRDYLSSHMRNIVDKQMRLDWVTTALASSEHLFSEDPCAPYAAQAMTGDTSELEHLCENLGIGKSSWFHRELALAQIREAIKLPHPLFTDTIPRLLDLLDDDIVLQHQGLLLILNKYASVPQPAMHASLHKASVEWWGIPWLPQNAQRWVSVAPAARAMVSEWLKSELIEAFFIKLAQEDIDDHRRADFWLRFVNSMDNIQIALGAKALHSRDQDLDALRRRIAGLTTELKSPDRANNALIMTLGELVVVEFAGSGNPLYGYGAGRMLPFDATRAVETTVNAPNSLKHRNHILWMQHEDGVKGWSKWEGMFEATLKEHFEIRPSAPATRTVARIISQARPTPSPTLTQMSFSAPSVLAQATKTADIDDSAKPNSGERGFNMMVLLEYARAHELKIDDMTGTKGRLWIRTGDKDLRVNNVLRDWGFQFDPGRGWWI